MNCRSHFFFRVLLTATPRHQRGIGRINPQGVYIKPISIYRHFTPPRRFAGAWQSNLARGSTSPRRGDPYSDLEI